MLEVTRKFGISEATYYVWRKRYGQIAVALHLAQRPMAMSLGLVETLGPGRVLPDHVALPNVCWCMGRASPSGLRYP